LAYGCEEGKSPTKVGRTDQELLYLSQAQYSIAFSTSTPSKREIEIKRNLVIRT